MLKIFKNKVGRPSNETIRKRRIIISSLIAVVIIFVGLIVINKDKIFNLKGAVSKANISINYDCDSMNGTTDKCNKLSFDIDSNEKVYFSYKLGNNKTYTISKSSPKTKFSFDVVQAFKKSNLSAPSVTDGKLTVTVYNTSGSKISSKTVTLKQNGFYGKTYYYNQDNYSDTVFCGRTDGDSIAYAGCGLVSSAMAMSALTQTKVLPETLNDYVKPSNNAGNDIYACTGSSGIGEISKLFENYGQNVLGINFKVEQIWTVSEALSKLDENKGKSVAIFHSENDAFTGAGHYYFISGITGTSNDDYIYIYDPKSGDTRFAYNTSKYRNGKWRIGDYRNISNVTLMYVITNLGKVTKNITLECPASANVNKKFKCQTNQAGVTISLGGANSLAKGISSKFVTTLSDMSKSIQYTNALFTNYKSLIKKDSKGEYINAQVTAAKGSKKVTKKVKIYRPKTTTKTTTTSKKAGKVTTTSKLKNFTLSCPKSINVNTKFECKADERDVRIGVGGVNGLASGYKSVFTTGLFDKSMSIKYTDKLFTNYKSLIKVDGNGKQYINAKVTAKKSGYKTVTTHVRVYNGKTVNKTNTAKKTLSFTCPSAAKVGEKIVCVTDQAGVTIRTSNPEALASGYTEKFVTTTGDYTKSLSYTKAGTYYVKATKSGYKEVKKTIKITASASNNANSLVLTCPSSVYVNEPILCTTNMVGVTIRGSNPESLAAGTSDRFVTTASDLSKSLKYKKAGTYYVKASKSGYGEVKKAITVKNRVTQTTVDKAALYGIGYNLNMERSTLNQYNKNFNIKLTSVGSQVKYQSFVTCFYQSECTRSDAWDYQKKTYGGGAVTYKKEAKVGKTESLTLKTPNKNLCGQVYYVRATTYDKNEKIKHVLVSRFSIDNNCSMTSNVVSSNFY